MAIFTLILSIVCIIVRASNAFLETDTGSNTDHLSLLHLISQEQALRLELETQVIKLRDQIHAIQSQLANNTVIVNQNIQQVAFSGRLSQSLQLPSMSIVKFDDVITNIGNAYSTTSGIFLCPISGLYLFSLNILSDNDGEVYAFVYQNKIKIARPFIGSGQQEHEGGSNTVVVHANIGDKIFVNATSGTSSYLDHFSLFTGILLKAD